MRDVIVIGVGELGLLFGGAALRAGIRVTPVTRQISLEDASRGAPSGTPVLVAVGEADLPPVLAALTGEQKRSVILLQNELFPSVWKRHGADPTVLVPWLLKKKGQPEITARPTPIYGRHAALVRELHQVLGVPCVELAGERELQQALVEKYTFILTINALGVLRDRTLGGWLEEDPRRVEALALEAAMLGERLCEARIEQLACVRATREGMVALAAIPARGRTAQARVERALSHATRLGVDVPELRSVLDGARSGT